MRENLLGYLSSIRFYLKTIKYNYRHFIFITLVFISLLFSVFYFKYADNRLLESIKSSFSSLLYYFNEILELKYNVKTTINDFTIQPFENLLNLPKTWEEFREILSNYWTTFFSKEMFLSYIKFLTNLMSKISKILLLFTPLIMMIFLLIALKEEDINNDYNVDTDNLSIYKKIENKYIIPIKNWFLELHYFILDNSYYIKILLLIWAYNFNIISIFVSFLGYYFYLISSFDFTSIYIQLVKLLIDLSVPILFIPKFIWFILIIILFHSFRKNLAYNKLNHLEFRNRGFINERPIVLMLCGTMGKGKTTLTTDMALSQESIFRNKAFEMLKENDMKFPHFPWIVLENELKKVISKHVVYNLSTCKKYVNSKKIKFYKNPCMKNLFYYNYDKYGYYYDNGLEIVDIWDVIEIYCKTYFMYIIKSSLIYSNYSIRVDNNINDLGNFPLWNTDFFKKDSLLKNSLDSKHSHILDFDSLRLGKNLIKDNKFKDSFEFGVVNLTEIGKERGNNLELNSVKKNDEKCNQKNDLFNYWLKMARHPGTIDNYPFVKVITDEQRPESWGADARDLCEIVHIIERSDLNLAIPFFNLESLLIDILYNKFSSKYYDHRFNHGNNNLFMYIYKGFISFIYHYLTKIKNTFGYYELNLEIEKGTQDGILKNSKYYLMRKKIYSNRFSTDCYSDFFNNKNSKSNYGIEDIPTYKFTKATIEEMKQQNSYFFNDLSKIQKNNDDEKK